MEPYPWTCPFCGRDTTIVGSNHSQDWAELTTDNAQGRLFLRSVFVVCPNAECRQVAVTVSLHKADKISAAIFRPGSLLASWSLIPPSQAKVFPDYVPKPIRDDYQEACLIRDLSPKASATLSRRCLQGMIRDFWKVTKPKLAQEIDAIKDKVDSETWGAIDGVRSIGNIGAHMEEDINVIIDVEPEEAGHLIWLIELLIKDWYINRHERQKGLKTIQAISKAKSQAKSQSSPQ
jgi:hypothetical protein